MPPFCWALDKPLRSQRGLIFYSRSHACSHLKWSEGIPRQLHLYDNQEAVLTSLDEEMKHKGSLT